MQFILYLILIYFIFRLISFLTVRILSHKISKANKTEEFTENERKKKRKKVFRSNDGDYVDFEEIHKKQEQDKQ